MTSYLKVILSAAGAVALLAAPAMAKTAHHATRTGVPAYGAAAETHAPAPRSFVTPYGADVPQPAHAGSVNPDFQVPGNQ